MFDFLKRKKIIINEQKIILSCDKKYIMLVNRYAGLDIDTLYLQSKELNLKIRFVFTDELNDNQKYQFIEICGMTKKEKS